MIAKFAGLALGATLLAGAADAEPLFSSFERLCAKPSADAKSALSLADAEGWMTMPAALLSKFQGSRDFEVSDGRIKSDGAGMHFLLVGVGSRAVRRETLTIRMCAVGATPADGEAVKQDAATWTGMSPNKRLSAASDVAYAFEERDGARIPVGDPSSAQARTLVAGGRLKLLFVKADKQMTMIAYGVPSL
ncbi:MAG TPA: hypothetical protein VIO94_10205 [Phenylobacterium sp.]